MSNESTLSGGLHLVVFNTEEILQVLPLPAVGVVTIGRSAGNTVQVTDRAASRQHMKIAIGSERGELRLTVEDLGSVNGTRVNSGAIQAQLPTSLSLGELVTVGSTALVVMCGDPPPVPGLFADLRQALDRREEEARIDLRARAALLNAKRKAGRSVRSRLELLVPPKGEPPAPSSSGAPLALPGPGYLFDDLIRGRGGRR